MNKYLITGIGIILVALLVGAGVYITTNEMQKYIYNQRISAAQEGYTTGQLAIVNELAQCKSISVPLSNNVTMTIVAKECLQN